MLSDPKGGYHVFAWKWDGQYLASSGTRRVREVPSGMFLLRRPFVATHGAGPVFAYEQGAPGRYMVGRLQLTDPVSIEEIQLGKEGIPEQLEVSVHGKALIATDIRNGTAYVFNASNEVIRSVTEAFTMGDYSWAMAPDGTRLSLAVIRGGSLEVRQVIPEERILGKWSCPAGTLSSNAFFWTPDGDRLLGWVPVKPPAPKPSAYELWELFPQCRRLSDPLTHQGSGPIWFASQRYAVFASNDGETLTVADIEKRGITSYAIPAQFQFVLTQVSQGNGTPVTGHLVGGCAIWADLAGNEVYATDIDTGKTRQIY
jgi:hypothetical protein